MIFLKQDFYHGYILYVITITLIIDMAIDNNGKNYNEFRLRKILHLKHFFSYFLNYCQLSRIFFYSCHGNTNFFKNIFHMCAYFYNNTTNILYFCIFPLYINVTKIFSCFSAWKIIKNKMKIYKIQYGRSDCVFCLSLCRALDV